MNPQAHHCFLADDLSGALEVGAVFHGQNRPVRISLRPGPLPEWETGTVLGFDVDSRAKTSSDAYQSVFELAKTLRKEGHPIILKKIDSTMRGWIGQEIQAVLDSECADAVALCPTHPAVGRTVKDGVLLVEGVPVHQTAFKHDPAFPIRCSRVDEITRAQTDASLRHCPLQVVRSSGASLTAWIAETMDSGISILGFDAITEQDLDSIAQATLASGSRILPCGSGAMAAAVGRVLNPRTNGGSGAPEKQSSIGRKRTAFLIGSAHPSSLAQFENLLRARPLTVFRFDPNNPASWSDTLQTSIQVQKDGVIALLPETQGNEKRLAETAEGIQEFFHRFAKTTPPEELPQNWFITGGETARTIIDALSLEYLDIVDELDPGVGVAVSTTPDPIQSDSNHTLITKPGGFGHPYTLINCYDYFSI
ncbi:MAG: hypothetical protein DRP71_12070 [Verrucomicrobia bacterium]|nr:MAG: hypothetical protein DRP71_12070 [Verrucomicrobiota bacterium]